MGQLVEQAIRTLFNGVSRQPHPVRLPSQLQAGENILASVVTGGFEKRPATQHVAKLVLDPMFEYALHVIDRDANEKYAVVLGNSTLQVFDLTTGAAKTINALAADAVTYLNALPSDYVLMTVADYTFVVNKTVTVAMEAATTGTVAGTVQSFAKLPASPALNDIYKIQGDETTAFDDYYVKWDGSVWAETVNPNGQNSFDATTMPYQLVRESNGTFTFSKATWNPRPVGDANSVPPPGFVGRKLNDIFFLRGRLGFLADEVAYLGQAGDVFNMWPDKAFDVLDSDPIELPASTNKVTILRHAVPFRKALFVTADAVQFEITATDRMTPKSAAIDVTTSYQIDPLAKPVAMGDQVYFAGSAQGSGLVYEYFFNGDTFSNSAADVTKHVLGYVPEAVRMMTASTIANRLFLVPDGERHRVYVYTSYWNGTEKAQSAWCRYIFGPDDDTAYVMGLSVVADFLYILIARGDDVCIEKMPVDTEGNDPDLGFAPLYDRRVQLTGVYDAGTNKTTWTLPYTHANDVKVLLGGSFPTQRGRILNVTYPSSTEVTATGDFSAGDAYLGIEYEKRAELSKQFLRDANGSAVTTGRLQLRHMFLNYRNTGYFEVWVTPEARSTRIWKMTGKILGSARNVIGSPSIEELGAYRVRVESRADTTKIEIVNSSPYPSVITGGAWVGFYNNIARQG